MRICARLAATLFPLLVTWQAVIWIAAPPPYIVPSPHDMLAAFARQPGWLLSNSLVTLGEIGAGFAAGTGLGVLTALVIVALPRLGRAVWPLVLVLQAFPVFVIAPLLVLWFGFGMASKVAMTTLIIFFPVASAFTDGLRRVTPEIVDASVLCGASPWQALVHIRIPLAMPSLVTGLRVAAPLAPLGAIIGEWVGASAGLGFVMMQANARMQTDTVFAAMALIVLFTLALRAAVDRTAPHLAPWAGQQRPSRPS